MGVLRRLQPRHTGGGPPMLPPPAIRNWRSSSGVGRGDQAAFADLYDTIAPLVHGVVLKVVRDPSQAEEVVQEVFVELWRVAPRFDPGARDRHVSGWRRSPTAARSIGCARSRPHATGSSSESTRVERPHDDVAESVVAVDQSQFDRRRVDVPSTA